MRVLSSLATTPRRALATPMRPTPPERSPLRCIRRPAFIATWALFALGCSPSAIAITVEELQAEVEAGRSAAVYATYCSTQTDIDVRPPQFDLWCGVAAVDVGRPGEGVLALERYVLQFPEDTRARLELARAYFYAGDDVRSRAEFEGVAKLTPPADVQAGIDRYLAALSARESRYLGRKTFFIEAGGGYDSNANAGVAQADIGLPVLGPVSVDPFAVRQSSGFGWLAAGADIYHPVAPGWTLSAGARGNGTFYGSASEFDLDNYGVYAAGSFQNAHNVYTLTYAHGEIELDNSRYRWTDGVGLEWRHALSEFSSLVLYPQYARIAYAGDNAPRNADLSALSVGYRQVWPSAWQPVLNAAVFYGDEHNREGRGDLGRDLWGGNINLTLSPTPSWATNFDLGYVRSDYSAPIPLLDVTREDRNLTATITAIYLVNANFSVRAEYQYARNTSNLELYEYTRHVGAIKFRYDYR